MKRIGFACPHDGLHTPRKLRMPHVFRGYLLFFVFFQFWAIGCFGTGIAEFVLAIDIGHSRSKFGAVSALGLPEFGFNASMARQLSGALGSVSAPVRFFFINPSGKDITLPERCHQAMLGSAGLLLSIHHDSVQSKYLRFGPIQGRNRHYCDLFRGYSLFVSRKNGSFKISWQLATVIANELLAEGFTPTLHHAEKIPGENRELLDKERGIYNYDNLVVLKGVEIPALLIECGVIINPTDEQLFLKPAVQWRFAEAVARGVKTWLFDRFHNNQVVKPQIKQSK